MPTHTKQRVPEPIYFLGNRRREVTRSVVSEHAMPNPHRGEIEARLDGKPYRLCLTLGALAELEPPSATTTCWRWPSASRPGRLSARDAQRIIGAGLRGAGHDIADEAVARMQADGGAAGFVDIVARLLGATFGGGSPPHPIPVRPRGEGLGVGVTERSSAGPRVPGGTRTPVPFPGTT